MERLSEKEWKEFGYEEFFALQKQKNKLSATDCPYDGKTPMYASQSQNNGVMGFTDGEPEIDIKRYRYLIFDDHTRCTSLVQCSFSTVDNVKIPKSNGLNTDDLAFIAVAWEKWILDMEYARHWRKVKTVGISLPVDYKGNPDYNYMTLHSAKVGGVRSQGMRDLSQGNFPSQNIRESPRQTRRNGESSL